MDKRGGMRIMDNEHILFGRLGELQGLVRIKKVIDDRLDELQKEIEELEQKKESPWSMNEN